MSKFHKIISLLLLIALLIIGGFLIYIFLNARTPAPLPPVSLAPPSSEEQQDDTPLHIQAFPIGEYGPDTERLEYENESMILSIPRLNLTLPVQSIPLKELLAEAEQNGISSEEEERQLGIKMNQLLDNGPTLFNQSQLPGPENRNVSIAAHRDAKAMEFYYIDTLAPKDKMYLYYQGKQYVYEYEKTFITDENDWEPIATTEFSQITLQSCDPIYAPYGQYDRIFVVGILVGIYEKEPQEEDDSTEENSLNLSLWEENLEK